MVARISTVLAIALLAAALIAPAAAAQAGLSVTTDKASYGPGERVVITVSGAAPGRDVVVAVFNPRGDLVFADQGAAGPAGTFTTSFTLPSEATSLFPLGTYTVRAQQDTSVVTTTFTFQTLAAFTTVSGRVVDAATGEPVEDAVVRLVKPDGAIAASGRTDINGVFSINVDPGSYTLKVMAANYLSFNMSITVNVGTNDVGVIGLTSIESLILSLVLSLQQQLELIPQLQAQLSSVQEQLSSLSSRIDALSSQLEALSSEFRAAQAQLTVALGNISSKLDTALSDIADLRDRAAAITTAVSGLRSDVAAVSTAVSDIRTRVAVLDDLRTAVTQLTTQLTNLRTDVQNLGGRLDTVATDLRNSISGVASSVNSVSDKADTAIRGIESLNSKADSISSSVGSLTPLVAVAMVLALLAFVFALLSYLQIRKATAPAAK